MKFRKAVKTDLNDIMNIIKQAQADLKAQGINQWQNHYPNSDTITTDINNGNGYVLLKDNIIVGTVAVIFDGETTYDHIYHGEWLSHLEYATIHRIAIDSKYKGLGLSSIMIKNIEQMCLDKGFYSIKVDTHEENLSMQRLLQKNNFHYCGIIYLQDQSKRIAFEKILTND